MRGLVLDLRGNPGGDLDALLRLADDFLPRGAPILEMHEPDGDVVAYSARQGRPYAVPLVLLVDGRTASAAELFAGCLQANGRSLLVGDATFGKGTATRVVPAANGSGALRAEAAAFSLPGGRPVQALGITPDWVVPRGRRGSTRPSGCPEQDEQLRAAVLLVRALLGDA